MPSDFGKCLNIMPNWCVNELIITGEKEEVAKFKRKARGEDTDLSLENFVPTPKELVNLRTPPLIVSEKEYKKKYQEALEESKRLKEKGIDHLALPITKKMSKELIKKYGTNNWYDWRIANWGTKWDVDAELRIDNETYLAYSFDSAWSPPLTWLEKVAKQFPKLHFKLKYEEEGLGFMGIAIGMNGEVVDNCLDYV